MRFARVVVVIVAVFFFVTTVLAAVVTVAVAVPGTALDGVWALKEQSKAGFYELGAWGAALMGVLTVVLAATAIGLVRRKPWARWVSIALLAINVVPEAIRGFAGAPDQFFVVVPIAALAVYLAFPPVGRTFRARMSA